MRRLSVRLSSTFLIFCGSTRTIFRTAFRAAIRRLIEPLGDGPAGQRARAPGARVRSTAAQAVGVSPPRRAEAPRTLRQSMMPAQSLALTWPASHARAALYRYARLAFSVVYWKEGMGMTIANQQTI